MQETLISFETAKLAKEKGFNWKVRQIYDNNGKKIDVISHTNKSNQLIIGNSSHIYNICAAPSQSLLQKWLREIHDIHIKIFPEDDTCNNRIWDISLFQLNYGQDKEVHYLNSNGCKKTFEEALEIGLLEALKLIKK